MKYNTLRIIRQLLKNELEAEKRIIFRNEHFTVFLPFYCEYRVEQ